MIILILKIFIENNIVQKVKLIYNFEDFIFYNTCLTHKKMWPSRNKRPNSL